MNQIKKAWVGIAWELKSGKSHLVNILTLATALIERGHQVTLFLQYIDKAVFQLMRLNPDDFNIIQAPRIADERFLSLPEIAMPFNYTVSLNRLGYRDGENLALVVGTWDWIIHQVPIDLLILDSAPTALVAARADRNIRVISIGNGIDVLPHVTQEDQLPCFYSHKLLTAVLEIHPYAQFLGQREVQQLALTETSVIKRINNAIKPCMINKMTDLMQSVTSVVCTFPELDFYAQDNENYRTYVCPAFVGKGRKDIPWPEMDQAKRLLVFSGNEIHHLKTIKNVVSKLQSVATTIVYEGYIIEYNRSDYSDKPEIENIAICNEWPDEEAAIQQADYVMCSDPTLVALALKHGKPCFVYAEHLREIDTAALVKHRGLGDYGLLNPQYPRVEEFLKKLNAFLVNETLVENAKAFSQKHQLPSLTETIINLVESE